jgi:hypothetical protein
MHRHTTAADQIIKEFEQSMMSLVGRLTLRQCIPSEFHDTVPCRSPMPDGCSKSCCHFHIPSKTIRDVRFEASERLYLQEGKHRDTGRAGSLEMEPGMMMQAAQAINKHCVLTHVSALCARFTRRAVNDMIRTHVRSPRTYRYVIGRGVQVHVVCCC